MKKSKKIYVDTENVQDYECLKKMKLTEDDEIILFFSQHIKSMKVDVLNLLLSFKCKVHSICVETRGHNSLDMHIITNLSLNYSDNNNYYIFSNDNDYLSAIDHYKMLGYNNVNALHWEKESPKEAKTNSKKKNKSKKVETNQDELEVKRIYKACKNKADFHNELCKKFGIKGQQLYKQYKSTM